MSRLFALAGLLGLAAPLSAASPLPKVPSGFRVELVLEAPAIEAPTALCVAPNGDVYFAEDPMDMAGPPTKPLDKIWLLKGGDPKKKILFADKMWAVMGLEIVRDKLYVVHAPHVTVFTLDAEGKAKKREELFDDLGPPVAGVPSFNDHIPSGIRMGMDGWLYVSIGDKGIPKMTRKEKDGGSVHVAEGRWRHTKEGHHISLEGGGVIRFRPDGSGLEVFASGTRNHLDVPLDEHDRIFVRDNTDDGRGWWTRLMYLPPGGYMGYPWAYTQRPKETLPMIRDFGGGSPCGGYVYCDDGLPATYRGRIFHCEWGQGKVVAVKVASDGAGFKFVDQIEFMLPNSVKDFRPFSLRPTADGRGFYVTDWGFSGWLNPTKAGRLWKVTYTGNDVKPTPRGKDTDSIEQLIKALDHPAHSERLRAQRALSARGEEGVSAARKTLKDGKLSAQARRHALWVVAEKDSLGWKELSPRLTRDTDAGVRLEAIRALATFPWQEFRTKDEVSQFQHFFYKLAQSDPDPSVRLNAAQANYFWGTPIAMGTWARERDEWVRFAIIHSIRNRYFWQRLADSDWLKKESLKWTATEVEALRRMCADVYDVDAVQVLQHLAQSKDAGDRSRAIETLARVYKDRKPYAGGWWGTQPAAQKPPPRIVAWEGTPKVREAILGALADRDASVRKAAVAALIAANDSETLQPLIKQYGDEKDAEARVDLVRAIAGLPAAKTTDFLAGILKDGKNPETLRLEAIAGLEKSKTPAALANLAAAAAPAEPVAVQVRALEALGAMKAPQAKTVCAASLKSGEPSVRKTAASTLAKLGDPTSAALILPLLKDKEPSVRTAAIQSLGTLKSKDAVPALIQAAGDEATQFDALTALAQMPDKRALSAYLTGLASKNADLRKACRDAVAALRDDVVPTLEQLAKRNEIPAAALTELREVYSSFAPILSWRIIGPFPRDGKTHPPQTEQKFDSVYKGAEKDVKWQTIQADAKQHGRVNLEARLRPNQQVVAYAYAEIDAATARDAALLIGSDDTITVWLNGKKVHDFQSDRGWNYNQDKVAVHLEKGKNRLLIACGNSGGPWDFSVAISGEVDRYAFLKGGAQKFDLETFRAFARKSRGDAERGRKLFADVKGLACIKCHAVGGQGGQVGPDLAGIALRYKREDLMTSILEPSKVIAQGYETIVVETKKGQTLTGVFKGDSGDAVSLADNEGKVHRVAKKDIEERVFSSVSTMPNGLSDGMTLQDFADLVAFLEARREEKK
ncbi:MAG TPA: HEAT repeat domain-containing protein [Gemmataceae bacterium]|jgi:putative membrane-bound dehydrogenase-like protein